MYKLLSLNVRGPKQFEKAQTGFSLVTSTTIRHNFLARNLFLTGIYQKMGNGMGRQNRIQPRLVP